MDDQINPTNTNINPPPEPQSPSGPSVPPQTPPTDTFVFKPQASSKLNLTQLPRNSKKVLALGTLILFLVATIGGIILARQRQEYRERAAYPITQPTNTPAPTCPNFGPGGIEEICRNKPIGTKTCYSMYYIGFCEILDAQHNYCVIQLHEDDSSTDCKSQGKVCVNAQCVVEGTTPQPTSPPAQDNCTGRSDWYCPNEGSNRGKILNCTGGNKSVSCQHNRCRNIDTFKKCSENKCDSLEAYTDNQTLAHGQWSSTACTARQASDLCSMTQSDWISSGQFACGENYSRNCPSPYVCGPTSPTNTPRPTATPTRIPGGCGATCDTAQSSNMFCETGLVCAEWPALVCGKQCPDGSIDWDPPCNCVGPTSTPKPTIPPGDCGEQCGTGNTCKSGLTCAFSRTQGRICGIVCPDKSIDTTPPCVCGTASPTPSRTPTPSRPPPTNTPPGAYCYCAEVKVYDEDWNAITTADIRPGETYHFTVLPASSSGLTKARFRINGGANSSWCNGTGRSVVSNWCETTTKKPGSNEFYVDYTIPAAGGTFTVEAEVYCPSGWQ